MPDIFYMFVVFAMLIVIGGFVLFLRILDMLRKGTNKAALGAAMVYLVERFKK